MLGSVLSTAKTLLTIQSQTKEALKWFNAMKKAGGSSFTGTADDGGPVIGELFFFSYNAKYRKTLPYWDAFPLVFPFTILPNHFIGLNLHYLPIIQRQALFTALMKAKKQGSAKKQLDLSYSIIKTLASSKLYEPCIHMYITNNLTSKLFRVKDSLWNGSIYLPVAKWQNGKPY